MPNFNNPKLSKDNLFNWISLGIFFIVNIRRIFVFQKKHIFLLNIPQEFWGIFYFMSMCILSCFTFLWSLQLCSDGSYWESTEQMCSYSFWNMGYNIGGNINRNNVSNIHITVWNWDVKSRTIIRVTDKHSRGIITSKCPCVLSNVQVSLLRF